MQANARGQCTPQEGEDPLSCMYVTRSLKLLRSLKGHWHEILLPLVPISSLFLRFTEHTQKSSFGTQQKAYSNSSTRNRPRKTVQVARFFEFLKSSWYPDPDTKAGSRIYQRVQIFSKQLQIQLRVSCGGGQWPVDGLYQQPCSHQLTTCVGHSSGVCNHFDCMHTRGRLQQDASGIQATDYVTRRMTIFNRKYKCQEIGQHMTDEMDEQY